MKEKRNAAVWIGMDWGHQKHAVAVVTDTAEAMEHFTVADSPQGYEELGTRLAGYGKIQGLALESTRHSVLEYLKLQDYPVYLINPKQSKAWRETDTVSGAKSDARDGLSLARGLAFRHKQLTPLKPGDPAVERLALLCEKECGYIHKRTALVQELKAILKLYYPAILQFFNDWTSPAAWDFLLRFPTAGHLVRARQQTVVNLLKKHHLGASSCWKKRLENRCNAANWPAHPHEDVYGLQAEGIIRELKAGQETLAKFRKEIEDASAELSHMHLTESLPGAGDRLAPRLMAIVGSQTAQEGGLQAVRGHTGVAPVTVESGKRKQVRIRYMCNKHWRNTMHLFAWCSTRVSPWAKAFYNYRKDKGDTHSTALRKLADKWLKIIIRMFETNEAYSEEKHQEALRRGGSPTWQYLKKQKAGA